MNPSGRQDGRVVVVVGSSGSGKSAWVKQQISRHRRVLVWDIEGEYERETGFLGVHSRAALVARLRACKGPARIAYVPGSVKEFGWWARCAFAWGRLAPCAVVAEETADVTNPSKAPEGWGQLIRRGRKWGIVTYAVTQRPAESDKTAVGNAALIHCGRLARAKDRVYMAAELDIELARMTALKPLEWIEREAGGTITAGRVTFPARAPTPAPKPIKQGVAPAPAPAPARAPVAGWSLEDL
jgi:hypothetical protein